MLANFENTPFVEIDEALAAILFAQPSTLLEARQFVTVDPARFAGFVGEYQTSFIGRTHTVLVTQAEG